MRSPRLAILAMTFCIASSFICAKEAFGASEDAPFLQSISSQPNSESARFDFAFFLYKGKRFAEARAQLMVLFGLNGSHIQGRKLHRHMNEIEGLNDTSYMDRQMQAYISEKEREDANRTTAQKSGSALSSSELDLITKDLERNYGLATSLKNEYKPLKDEESFRADAKLFGESGAFDRAERKHKEWIQKFPDSPLAQIEFLKFLVNRDRIEQAKIIFDSRKMQFGHFARYRFVGNCIQETKNAKSAEQKTASKTKMQRYMLVYESLLEKQMVAQPAAGAPSQPNIPSSTPGEPVPAAQASPANAATPALPPPPPGVVSGALPSRSPTEANVPAAKTNP
jgi:hypothetical protein